MLPAVAGRQAAVAGHQPEVRQTIAQRLTVEFMGFSPETVARCVSDAWACARHLGLEVTPPLVERFARERLTAMAKSEPPSGRFPPPKR
ncbi:MAG TPA: hypothetical protein VF069_18040 [Streptosporangiaceae bacterium]